MSFNINLSLKVKPLILKPRPILALPMARSSYNMVSISSTSDEFLRRTCKHWRYQYPEPIPTPSRTPMYPSHQRVVGVAGCPVEQLGQG